MNPSSLDLGFHLFKAGRSVKSKNTIAFWLEIGVLGLGAFLRDLGHKLGYVGQSWGYVGTFLAACWGKDAEDEPRWTNMNAKRVALGNEIWSGWCCHWRFSARFESLGAFKFGKNLKILLRTFILIFKRCLRLWRGRRISNALPGAILEPSGDSLGGRGVSEGGS